MADAKDGTESRQLARLEKNPELVGNRIVLTYTRLDGDAPKPGQSAGQLKNKIPEDIKAIMRKLKAGDEVVVVKIKDGKFWPLLKTEDASTFKPKEKSSWAGGKSSNDKYDNVGVKVGAARNQAIAYLTATKGGDFTLDDVDEIAYQILPRQAAQENALRNGALPIKMMANIIEELEVKDDDWNSDTTDFNAEEDWG